MIPEPTQAPTLDEYHGANDRWSSSRLKTFRESPALAHRMFVTRAVTADPPSKSCIIGTAAHACILGFDPPFVGVDVDARHAKTFKVVAEARRRLISGESVQVENCARTTKQFRAAVKDHPNSLVVTGSESVLAQTAADHLHALLLTAPEAQEVRGIAEAITRPRTRAGSVARALLTADGGHSEYYYEWDDVSGVPCKLMVDRLLLIDGRPTVVDLKTTVDPSPEGFAKHCVNFGYDHQAAFNRRGLANLLGELPDFYCVAVRNSEPYEVAVYEMSQDFLRRGERGVERSLRSLAACLESDDPSCWSQPWEQFEEDIPVLELPRWAA